MVKFPPRCVRCHHVTLTHSKTRKLVNDERSSCLPIPHVGIVVRDTNLSRLGEHYHNTLADDLPYMTYKHESGARPPPRDIRLMDDPEGPYIKLRHNPPVGGSQLGRKLAPPTTTENVLHLERIRLHTMAKDALVSRQNLLGPLMALRALSGETEEGGGLRGSTGVQVVRGVKSVGSWVCPGLPLGAKVDLRGTKMYEFLGTLTKFVLPRLREFPGLLIGRFLRSLVYRRVSPADQPNLIRFLHRGPRTPLGLHSEGINIPQNVPSTNTSQENVHATRAVLDHVEALTIPSHAASPIIHNSTSTRVWRGRRRVLWAPARRNRVLPTY